MQQNAPGLPDSTQEATYPQRRATAGNTHRACERARTGLRQPMRELLAAGGLLKPALSEGGGEERQGGREGEGREAEERMKGVREKHPGLLWNYKTQG